MTESENLRAWLEVRRDDFDLKAIARNSKVNYTVLTEWLKGIHHGSSPRKLSQTSLNNLVDYLQGKHGYEPLTGDHHFL